MTSKKLTKRILLALAAGMLGLAPTASALPSQGSHDNSASATIATAGNTMNITGKGANNVINWATFSIAKGETVNFTDKGNYLNLVNGVDTSRIYGTISGGNMVYLINPYGILFGEGATLNNVGALVASTRDLSDINQANFLSDPTKVQNVLYSNDHASRNKDYYPDSSPFVPTISVADIALTNVPESATQIVLDSPGGVILKSTEVLDKVSRVQTEKFGGEIGMGAEEFYAPVALTEAQKKKLYVFDGKEVEAKPEHPITPYQWIHDVNELQAVRTGTYINYMLVNDIDASGVMFKSIGGGDAIIPTTTNTYRGTFDGMGYEISKLSSPSSQKAQGIFTSVSGTIRNIGVHYNLDANNNPAGAITGFLSGNMSNVYTFYIEKENVSGKPQYGTYYSGGIIELDDNGGCIGGLVGILYTEDSSGVLSEIRNSHNSLTIIGGTSIGGIVGKMQAGSLFNVYNQRSLQGFDFSKVGGIVGETSSWEHPEQRIISAYNAGGAAADDYGFAGGIIGVHNAGFPIGDAYNSSYVNRLETVNGNVIYGSGSSGIIGYAPSGVLQNATYISKEHEIPLESYYDSTKIRGTDERLLGTSLSEADFKEMLDKSIFGTNTSGIPYMIPQKSPASTGTLTPVIPNDGTNNAGGNSGNNSGSSTNNGGVIDNTGGGTIIDNTGNNTENNGNTGNNNGTGNNGSNNGGNSGTNSGNGNNTGNNGGHSSNTGGGNSGNNNGGNSGNAGGGNSGGNGGGNSSNNGSNTGNGGTSGGSTGGSTGGNTGDNNSGNGNVIQQSVLTQDYDANLTTIKNNQSEYTWKDAFWDSVKDIPKGWKYFWNEIVFKEDKSNIPSTEMETLATELQTMSPQHPYDKNVIESGITRSGEDGSLIPQELVDKFASIISEKLYYSDVENQTSSNGYKQVYATIDSLFFMPNQSIKGIEYDITQKSISVMTGNAEILVSWTDKNRKTHEGTLKWSGEGTVNNFMKSCQEYGKEKCEAVYEACALDAIGVLKWLKDDTAEVPKLLKKALGNKATKKSVKQVIKEMPEGTKFLQKLANFTYDAYLQ